MRHPNIVVTGLSIVSAVGVGREAAWDALVRGESGIRPLELFDPEGYRTRNVAAVPDSELLVPERLHLRATASRAERFALFAAREALEDAALASDDLEPGRFAVLLGASASGVLETEDWLTSLLLEERRGPLAKILCHGSECLTNRVASELGAEGPRSTVAAACSSASLAIGQASDLLRSGLADVALAGGADALARLTCAGFSSLRVVDPEPCRPFDRERKGLSLGEGAGMLILEREESARARGARIYCHLAGYGVTADAHHMTAPDPSGAAGERTLRAALADAELSPDDIDHVNAHGTATPQNDRAETAALYRLMGERAREVPTNSIKSMVGHCLCAAGGVEAAVTCLTLARGVIPPTLRWQNPDPDCELDVVPGEARRRAVHAALSNSFAFGGNSASLAFVRDGAPSSDELAE